MKTKVTKHIPPRYSLFTVWMFDGIGNKHNVYRGENCIKKMWNLKGVFKED